MPPESLILDRLVTQLHFCRLAFTASLLTMASTEHQFGESSPENPAKRTIFLNVLSPSAEVPEKLTYPAIPTSTTILELKQKIQTDIETRPSPERQRLIYRGRALVQDDRTLEDIFGHAAV